MVTIISQKTCPAVPFASFLILKNITNRSMVDRIALTVDEIIREQEVKEIKLTVMMILTKT